ncbi:hypothetical protein B0H10DRAFT_2058902, partial [Mycena sp. CBHHK59/15]
MRGRSARMVMSISGRAQRRARLVAGTGIRDASFLNEGAGRSCGICEYRGVAATRRGTYRINRAIWTRQVRRPREDRAVQLRTARAPADRARGVHIPTMSTASCGTSAKAVQLELVGGWAGADRAHVRARGVHLPGWVPPWMVPVLHGQRRRQATHRALDVHRTCACSSRRAAMRHRGMRTRAGAHACTTPRLSRAVHARSRGGAEDPAGWRDGRREILLDM